MKLVLALLTTVLCLNAYSRTTTLAFPADTLSTDTTVTDSLATDSLTAKKKREKKEESEYEKLMKKGGSVQEGLFRVRHIEDKYYFEVPDSVLGRMLLCVTRFTSVPQDFGQFAGEEVTHCTVYFEQRDTAKLLLRQYVLSHLSDAGDNITRTLELSTIDPIVESFKIIGRNKEDGAQLIEVTGLFNHDNNLTSLSSTSKTALKVSGIQNDRTFIDTLCVFPLNIEVKTTRTYGSSASRSGASKTGNVTMGFNTSIVLLPEQPMRKRLWDDRIGYFNNTFVRFSDEQHKTEHEAFISRYRLVPKDKKRYLSGQLTEPVKPIIYYIDPNTPKKWIPYLIQGVNDWNVAFEAAGFKNAIQAREWPENDSTMSMEDARFSVIRYLPSETENAYGPRIVDPRSGEIIEAHVCWYHNVMSLLTKWYMVQCGPLDKRARTMHFDDKLMGQLIRFVSSHEVGHTLGLRHNMGASFATPVEKLRDKKWVEAHGHTSSIMDYARFNYVAQPEDHISERGLFPRIGDYDCWAIRWGYQWRPEFKDEYEEKEKLMTETSRVLRDNQRLWFGGEGGGSDPRSQTEDLGDNSMKASDYGIMNLKRVMEQLPEWTRQPNDQYEDLQSIYRAVTDQYMRYLNHVMRNVGGRFTGALPGQDPYADMPAERQREALQFMGRQLFDAPEWLYPEAVISKTGTDASADQASRQEAMIARLLAPLLLNNLCNRDTYPVGQYLEDLFQQVWRPADSDSDWKNKARRRLHRAYVQQINALLNPTEADQKNVINQRFYTSDALLYLYQQLDTIEQFCQQQLDMPAITLSSLNRLHYQDLLREIKLIRERRTTTK